MYKGVDKEMKIRKMVIEDYEKVYQLWMSCTGMGLNNLDDSQEGIETPVSWQKIMKLLA